MPLGKQSDGGIKLAFGVLRQSWEGVRITPGENLTCKI